MTCSDRPTANPPRTHAPQPVARRLLKATGLSVVVLGLAFGVVAAPGGATTYVPMTDAALADQAPLIIAGRVTAIDAAPVAGRPATDYTVSLARVLKGTAPADPLTVRVPGGVDANGAVYRVWGAPRFLEGDRVILFLEARRDGTFGISQLLLGAFVREQSGDRTLAVRDLSEAVALPRSARAGGAEADSTQRARDFTRFGDWLAARAAWAASRSAEGTGSTGLAGVAGRAGSTGPVADYFVDAPQGTSLAERYTLLGSGGKSFRWFNGGGTWYAYQGGVAGMSGGGFTEVQRALAAWDADPGSSLSLQYGGTTSRTGGFSTHDGANVVLFEDPNDEISGSFDCSSGGVLAIGGFSNVSGTADFGGTTYWRIVEGEVVTQDGAGCFFAGNGGKNGELVFAHEIGHALGLGHSCGDSGTPSCADPVLDDALMRAFAHNDGRGARLGDDDRAALAVLYGNGTAACTVPTAPAGLSATATSSSRIDLTWQDRSQDEDGFVVERKLASASSFTRLATLPAGRQSFADTGLAASTSYTYQVRATGCGGDSSAVGPVSARTLDPPPDPTPDPSDPPPGPSEPPPDPPSDPPSAATPYGLQANVLSQTEVQLTWSWDGAAPLDFRVELRSGVLFVEAATVSGSLRKAALDGLRPKTGYSFRVRARTSSGYGPYSEVVSVRTDPQAAGDPGALTAAQVACDEARLHGLLARLTVEAPNLPASSGRSTGINLSFTATGDFAGIAFTEPSGSAPGRELAFSTNPEETTLLRNPARAQLASVSLTRNVLNSDLVGAADSDRLRVTIDPTLTPSGSAPSDLLAIDNLSGSVDGATSAKPGRGLAGLLDTCHGELGADDVHVFRVLSKILRVESSTARRVAVAIYRGEASGTYRIDAFPFDGQGRSLGLVAAELEVTWKAGALDQGMLRVLPACGGGGSVRCTSFDAPAQVVLGTPQFVGGAGGGSDSGSEVQVSFAPATSSTGSEEAVDWTSLLASSTWLRPPAGAGSSGAGSASTSPEQGPGELATSQVACDGTRLEGMLDRLRVVAPGAAGRGVNLSYTASGDFAGIAYTVGAAGGERQLAFSTNPEETTLLRNPARPQLFAVSVSRNVLNSDLVTGQTGSGAGLLKVLLDPTRDGQGSDNELLLIDNRGDGSSHPADAKPGRGLTELVAPCHTRFADADVHLFRVLSKIVRAQAAGATATEIALYKGAGQNVYRIDAYLLTADGTSLGRMAAELTVGYNASGLLQTGTLKALPRCAGSVTTGCTSVDRAAEIFLVEPALSGPDTPVAGARVVSSGAPTKATVSFASVLGGTSWRKGI